MSHLKRESPLRTLRRTRLMNQEAFAQLLGVTQATVSKVERGRASFSPELQEMAAVILGSTRQHLFPESDVEPEAVSASTSRSSLDRR